MFSADYRLLNRAVNCTYRGQHAIQRLHEVTPRALANAAYDLVRRHPGQLLGLLHGVASSVGLGYDRNLLAIGLNQLEHDAELHQDATLPSRMLRELSSYFVRTCPEPLATLADILNQYEGYRHARLFVVDVLGLLSDKRCQPLLETLVLSHDYGLVTEAILLSLDILDDTVELRHLLTIADQTTYRLPVLVSRYWLAKTVNSIDRQSASTIYELAIRSDNITEKRWAAKSLQYVALGLSSPEDQVKSLLTIGDPWIRVHTAALIAAFLTNQQVTYTWINDFLNDENATIRRCGLMAISLSEPSVSDMAGLNLSEDDPDTACRVMIQGIREAMAQQRRRIASARRSHG
jgi:hypothetical protein